jgi:hypothetical protein
MLSIMTTFRVLQLPYEKQRRTCGDSREKPANQTRMVLALISLDNYNEESSRLGTLRWLCAISARGQIDDQNF